MKKKESPPTESNKFSKKVIPVDERLHAEEILFQRQNNVSDEDFNDDDEDIEDSFEEVLSIEEIEEAYDNLLQIDKKIGLGKLNLMLMLKPEYMDALNKLTNKIYNYEYIYKSRYIMYIKAQKPTFYNDHKNESVSTFMSSVEDQFIIDSNHDTKPVLKWVSAYSTFKKDQIRILSRMLQGLLMDASAYKILKDNKRNAAFGIYEYGFISFLLDTWESDDADRLCNSDFANLSDGYYYCVKLGVDMLARYHTGIDTQAIKNAMKEHEIHTSKTRLVHETKLLVESVNKVLNNNDCSTATRIYCDYISDIIKKATSSIDAIIE